MALDTITKPKSLIMTLLEMTTVRNCTACMWPLVKKDSTVAQLVKKLEESAELSNYSRLLLQPQLQTPPQCNFLLTICSLTSNGRVLLEIMDKACLLIIYDDLSKQAVAYRQSCHSFYVDHLVVRPILGMFSISTSRLLGKISLKAQ